MADDPKLTEFRDRNVALMKELDDLKAKYNGIDPEAVKADRLKLEELAKAKPAERITELETQLATEKAARTAAQKQADALVIATKVSDAFLKAGGLPKARNFIVAAATPLFTVEGGTLKGTTFSPNRPGEALSLDEWVLLQTKENSFCFGLSGGGGADPARGGGSTGVKELRDPTPQQLGEHAADVKAGRIKIVYS